MFIKDRPDFIILDVVMMKMRVVACVKKIRELGGDHEWVPIVFLAASDDNSINQGIDAGCDDYITKPFDEITLAAKIRAMQRIVDMQKKLYEATCKLRILASTDMLTGLANRFQFDKTIKEKIEYAARYHDAFALLFIDLDNFKLINDYLGHPAGDLLLKEFSLRLRASFRANDFISRLGGDEFAVILSRINHQNEAGFLAQRILNDLAQKYYLKELNLQVGCSIGIACFPENGVTAESLIQQADIAMYQAKALGRNNFQYYTEALQMKNTQRFYFESALRSALSNHEMSMNYQPVFNLNPKKMVGVEALIRWTNPKLGDILPEVFIPIAEEIGLITVLDLWAMEMVCKQAEKWKKQGYHSFKISINISARQFPQDQFIPSLKTFMRRNDISPALLEFELTESTIFNPSSAAGKAIKELAEMGIGISLDDFGTGYSSLMHLKSIPITTLKIDKSFIADIFRGANNDLLIQSIISLARISNLNLIAEGIETLEQFDFLVKHKCPMGQGFYLSKPLTVDEMTLFMRDQVADS